MTYVINNKEVEPMPRRNGPGPMGAGVMTKRGTGLCAGVAAGVGLGLGFCRRGFGRGFGNAASPQSFSKTQKALLQEQKELLQNRLEMIDRQLENL